MLVAGCASAPGPQGFRLRPHSNTVGGATIAFPAHLRRPTLSPALIRNAKFTAWTVGAFPTPDSWSVTATARTSFDIRALRYHGGVRMSVATTPLQMPGAIATPVARSAPAVKLSQPVQAIGRRLRVVIRPFMPCTIAGGRATAVTGVQITAASGSSAIFCIGSSHYSGRVRLAGRTVMARVVPGRIGAWNDVDFDVGPVVRMLGAPPFTLAFIAQVDAKLSPYDWVTMDVASVKSAP
jgi:hypothetical protein